MDTNTFNKIIESQQDTCTGMLVKKAEEYASDADRLHNFRVASVTRSTTMRGALGGMMVKHTTSIYDMLESPAYYTKEQWDEKITDHINYLLLLQAVLHEERKALPEVTERGMRLDAPIAG